MTVNHVWDNTREIVIITVLLLLSMAALQVFVYVPISKSLFMGGPDKTSFGIKWATLIDVL